MTTHRGPLVQFHLYASRTIMPTIVLDHNPDQRGAEQTKCLPRFGPRRGRRRPPSCHDARVEGSGGARTPFRPQ